MMKIVLTIWKLKENTIAGLAYRGYFTVGNLVEYKRLAISGTTVLST